MGKLKISYTLQIIYLVHSVNRIHECNLRLHIPIVVKQWIIPTNCHLKDILTLKQRYNYINIRCLVTKPSFSFKKRVRHEWWSLHPHNNMISSLKNTRVDWFKKYILCNQQYSWSPIFECFFFSNVFMICWKATSWIYLNV